jgi:hypothetical protein
MKSIKGSHVLGAIGWLFCFLELLGIMARKLPLDAGTIFTFSFFFLIAVFASATAHAGSTNRPKLKDGNSMRVKIAGQIFTGDSLTIMELKSGDLYVEVDLTAPQNTNGEPVETTKPVRVRKS